MEKNVMRVVFFLAGMLAPFSMAEEQQRDPIKETFVVSMNTGEELLRVEPDGEIYFQGRLYKKKTLVLVNHRKAYHSCVQSLLQKFEDPK